MTSKLKLLLAATGTLALATPALANPNDAIIVNQMRDKIAAAKASGPAGQYGAAELSAAEMLLPRLRENLDEEDKVDAESITRQIEALIRTAEVKAQVAAAREATAGMQAAGARAEVASARAAASDAQAQAAAASAQAAALRDQLRAMQMKQTALGATLVLQDVVFETGKATLRPGASQRLGPLVAYLRANPEVRVRIEGHTDSVGSTAYNQQLSQRRAEAVASAMANAGIDRARIDAVGNGEAKPVATNANAAGRQQNRRVELTLIGQKADSFAAVN